MREWYYRENGNKKAADSQCEMVVLITGNSQWNASWYSLFHCVYAAQ